eukprot:COSAG02_NODE_13423_length_1397_cov_1.137904_2_plen_96_part_00
MPKSEYYVGCVPYLLQVLIAHVGSCGAKGSSLWPSQLAPPETPQDAEVAKPHPPSVVALALALALMEPCRRSIVEAGLGENGACAQHFPLVQGVV